MIEGKFLMSHHHPHVPGTATLFLLCGLTECGRIRKFLVIENIIKVQTVGISF